MGAAGAPVREILKIIFSAGSIKSTCIFSAESSDSPADIVERAIAAVQAGTLPELENVSTAVDVVGMTYFLIH